MTKFKLTFILSIISISLSFSACGDGAFAPLGTENQGSTEQGFDFTDGNSSASDRFSNFLPAPSDDGTVTVADNAEDEILRLYEEILDRPADEAGIEYWLMIVNDYDIPISDLRRAFINSNESQENLRDLACMYFNSCGNQDLIDVFEDALVNGSTLDEVYAGLVDMVEDRIEEFFMTYLGREADDAGLEFWMDSAMNGLSESNVIAYFATSPEYQIRQIYLEVLNREPDEAGLEFWLGQYENGLTMEEIEEIFRNSNEANG